MKFPALETRRLRLRAPRDSDLDGFVELLSDPATHPYISDSGPVARTAVIRRLKALRAGRLLGRSVHWILEDRSDQAFVGYVAVHGPRKVPSYLSYAVRSPYRRRGFAREALLAVREHLSSIGCRTIVARSHLENRPSRALLLDLGFSENGCISTPAGERVEYRWP